MSVQHTGLLMAAAISVGSSFAPCARAEGAQDVRRVNLRVSVLHAGSTATEVQQVLGRPTVATELNDPESGDAALLYRTQNMQTRVVLTGGKVTAIAVDVVHFDAAKLPARARVIKVTMVRDGVTGLLGGPDADHRWVEAARNLEQMIYARTGEPEFSVYLADGLVVDVRPGQIRPSGLAAVVLPAAMPDTAAGHQLAIGLTPAQATPLLGSLASTIRFALKGQPVEYASYHEREGDGLVTVTYTGGVLTAFTIWPSDVL
jgi:hypothetical protein